MRWRGEERERCGNEDLRAFGWKSDLDAMNGVAYRGMQCRG